MRIELAIILVLGFIVIYVLMIKLFSILFRLTGLTKNKSKFQAISLITNTGFTTTEAEIITTSLLRRKVANAAMITGHVFSVIIVSLIFNLINNFSVQEFKSSYQNIIIVFAIFILLFIIFKLPFIKKRFEKFIEKIALRIVGKSNNENVISLLDNFGKEAIAEIAIKSLPEFLSEKSLQELNLREVYKLNILSLRRNGKIIAISKNTMLQNGDVLIIFGLYQSIIDLFKNNIDYIQNSDADESSKNKIEIIDNYGKDVMVKIKINNIPHILQEKTLGESKIKEDLNINIITIKRSNLNIKVTKDTTINVGDTITAFGSYANIKSLLLEDSKAE